MTAFMGCWKGSGQARPGRRLARGCSGHLGEAKTRCTRVCSREKTASAPKPARKAMRLAERVSEPTSVLGAAEPDGRAWTGAAGVVENIVGFCSIKK